MSIHAAMQAPSQILERGGALVKIPMSETHVRSLNLATSVGVGLYEVCCCSVATLGPQSSSLQYKLLTINSISPILSTKYSVSSHINPIHHVLPYIAWILSYYVLQYSPREAYRMNNVSKPGGANDLSVRARRASAGPKAAGPSRRRGCGGASGPAHAPMTAG